MIFNTNEPQLMPLAGGGLGFFAGIAGKRCGWREQGGAAGKERCSHEDSESLRVHVENPALGRSHPAKGPRCMGMMRLSETPTQVRKEQNSTVSRTCGVVKVCGSNSGRDARSVSARTDEQIPRK